MAGSPGIIAMIRNTITVMPRNTTGTAEPAVSGYSRPSRPLRVQLVLFGNIELGGPGGNFAPRRVGPAHTRPESPQFFTTSSSNRKNEGCKAKFATRSLVTAFCFQFATNTQGASSCTMVCIS